MNEKIKPEISCNICYSKKIDKNGEVYNCKNCEHMFKEFSFTPDVEMDFENGDLKIKRFKSNNIIFDIDKDSVMTFTGENMLEYTLNPQALMYELYRVASPGMKGEILFENDKKDIRNILSRNQVEMILKTAGFEIVRPNVFTRFCERLCKKKRIRFFKNSKQETINVKRKA